MADKVVLEAEVKSNIGEVSKDASSLAGEFQIMGVSLNTVKAGFVSIGKTAKASFATIKAGIASTGIGALLIAFGSLATFFTRTKKGAEILEVAFAGLGAAVSVIVDRVSKFGGAIVKLFQGDAKGALQDVKGAFTGIGEEIVNDTKQAIALKKAYQNLRDSQRELNVETAKQRAEIEKLKLIAEDVTKSTQERLNAAEKAFNKENKLLDDRIANAREDLRIQREGMELRKVDGKNTAEDLDREAELRIALFDIIGESSGKQIELNNKINAIQAETLAKRNEEMIVMEKMPELAQTEAEGVIQANNQVLENFLQNNDKKKKDAKLLADLEKQLAMQGLALATTLAKEGSVAAKGLAVTQATISGIEGVQNAYTTAQKSPFTALFPGYPLVQAGLAAAFSAVQIQKILSTSTSGGGGGGSAVGGSVGGAPQNPAPQMMSGAFDLTGGVEPEPTRAFVLTDEMTSSQNQLANIRRRATI